MRNAERLSLVQRDGDDQKRKEEEKEEEDEKEEVYWPRTIS